MPKKIDEQTLSKIEKIYLADDTETYSSLAKRFSVGVSTLERVGKERNWARKRDQQKARRATQLIKKTQAAAIQPLEGIDPQALDDSEIFGRDKLTRIIQKSLTAFEKAIEQNSDSPKALCSLAVGLCRLVEIHTKLNPPLTVSNIVDMLIQAGVQPDDFLSLLRQEWHHTDLKNRPLNVINN